MLPTSMLHCLYFLQSMNLLHPNQQTRTQRCLTALGHFTNTDMRPVQVVWRGYTHRCSVINTHTNWCTIKSCSPQTASFYSQSERRGGCHSGCYPGVGPASPSSVNKLQTCGKDGSLVHAGCADLKMKPSRSPHSDHC